MSTFYRLILALIVLSFFLAGCQTTVTPTQAPPTQTPLPATNTPLPPTLTPVPPTKTSVPPTATLQPTTTPVPEISRVIWNQRYNKKQSDVGDDLVVAADGGFYIVGTVDLDMMGTGSSGDVYLIRTDAGGKVLWDKTYEGVKSEEGFSITHTKDGKLLIAAKTTSSGAGGVDVYLLKIDLEGTLIWSKTLGSDMDEYGSARELADGGFMIYGSVVNPKDIIADPGAAGYDGFAGRSNIYLAKTDADGKQLWSRTFGGKNNLIACGGVEASDGGFVILASLLRYPEAGDDLYLLKVDKNGNQVWERTWKEGTMSAFDLIRTSAGQYLIAGVYAPADDVERTKADFLLIKVDAQGNELWNSIFGDPIMMDYPMLVTETGDGHYIAVGEWIKDWSGRSQPEIAIAKIDPNGKPVWQETIKTSSQHNMFRALLTLRDGNCLILGSRMDNRIFDIFLMKVNVGDQVRK